MKILDCVQGSPEWHEARTGVLTASHASELVTPKRKTDMEAWGQCCAEVRGGNRCKNAAIGPHGLCRRHGGQRTDDNPISLVASESVQPLTWRLVAERYLGRQVEEFLGNKWTDRGNELEPLARAAFEFETGMEARQVGFVYKGEDELVGCSPDWLMPASSAGAEVKCPSPVTHTGFLLGEKEMPTDYIAQVQFSLWVTGMSAWYFVSYCPEMPLYYVRMLPDEQWQKAFDQYVPDLLYNVGVSANRLKGMDREEGA